MTDKQPPEKADEPRAIDPSRPLQQRQQQQKQENAAERKPANGATAQNQKHDGEKKSDAATAPNASENLSPAELKKRAKAEKQARRARERQEREAAAAAAAGGSGAGAGGASAVQAGQAGKKGAAGGKDAAGAGQKGGKQAGGGGGGGGKTGTAAATPAETKKREDKNVAVFGHLYGIPRRSTIAGAAKEVHPAVLALGLQIRDYVICGSSARCVAMLTAFKRVRESAFVGVLLLRY